MKTNYFINIYEQYTDNTWHHVETTETKHGHFGVIDGRIHLTLDGKSIGECAMSQQEAEERGYGRYHQIVRSEPITDYVIATVELCHFKVRYGRAKYCMPVKHTIYVQLVNNRPPYYFVQLAGNWKWERTICSGENMQELKKGLNKYFNRRKFYFDNDEEQRKFEHLF